MVPVTIRLPRKYVAGIWDNLGRWLMKQGAWLMGFTLTVERELV